jgi:preprotein translocase subunit SecA
MREIERFLLLQIIDQRWTEHLYDMDYLREGIHLRGFAQIEPLVAYKNEAFELFRDLMNSIWTDFAQMIYHVEVTPMGPDGQPLGPPAPPPSRRRPSSRSSSATGGGRVTYSGGGVAQGAVAMAAAAAEAVEGNGFDGNGYDEPPIQVEQRRVDDNEQIGRNDPCWCGSGKKFKKCHGS